MHRKIFLGQKKALNISPLNKPYVLSIYLSNSMLMKIGPCRPYLCMYIMHSAEEYVNCYASITPQNVTFAPVTNKCKGPWYHCILCGCCSCAVHVHNHMKEGASLSL